MATSTAVGSLSAEKQGELKKCNTERLRVILLKENLNEEQVMLMERPVLMEKVAEIWLKPKPELSKIPETQRWEEEMKFREMQIQLQRQQLEWEKQKAERDAEERRLQLELEKQKEAKEAEKFEWQKLQAEREAERFQLQLEAEKQKADREAEERRTQLAWEKERWEREEGHRQDTRHAEQQKQRSLMNRLKIAADSLKHVLPNQPPDAAEFPLFFKTVEGFFASFEIDKDLQAKLLLPKLSTRSKAMLARMPPDDADVYEKVKKFLLTEYKLSPREYRTKFLTATRAASETCQLFASRLACLFEYYAQSRDVDNYKQLCQLLVADRLKECLPTGALQYVLSLEGDSWFEPSKIASLADVYLSNCTSVKKQSENVQVNADTNANAVGRSDVKQRLCFNCRSPDHLVANCDKKQPPSNAGNKNRQSGETQEKYSKSSHGNW